MKVDIKDIDIEIILDQEAVDMEEKYEIQETNNLSIEEEKEVNIITSLLMEETEFAKKCYEFDKEFNKEIKITKYSN